jgi:GT2 family glycosyltransferase
MKATVVIVTHGGWEHTERCLDSLDGQTLEHQVVVVDNASPDGTPARVRERWPQHVVLENADNRGFAVACNQGAAATAADVVVLLNNDTICEPAFLERLVAPLADDPGLGSVAGLLTSPGGAIIDSLGLSVDATLAGFPRLRGRPVAEAASPLPRLAGPSGGAGAYRRASWDEAGGLDERLFMYQEDLDLALRLRALGWGTVAAPDAVAAHVGGATAGRRSAWQRRQAGFSRGYLLRRYGRLRGRPAARTLVTEATVVAADAVIARDLAALRGRLAGWRSARSLERRPLAPGVMDDAIGLSESLRLRRVDLEDSGGGAAS